MRYTYCKVNKYTILIYDIIGQDWWTGEGITAKYIRSEVAKAEADNTIDGIDVRINSPGGSFMDGLAIFNTLASAKKPVNITIDGIAASMAAAIAFAKGKPTMAPNALLMLHTGSTVAVGNAQDFRTVADELDKFDNSLAVSLSQATGLDLQVVKDTFFNHKDNWLTAQEAADAGLVVIGDASAVDVADIKNLTIDQVYARYAKINAKADKESFIKGITNAIKGIFPVAHVAEPKPVDNLKPTDNVKIKATMAALLAVFAVAPKENEEVVELQPTDEQLKAVNDALVQAEADKTALANKEQELTAANARIAELEKTSGATAAGIKSTVDNGDGGGATAEKTPENIIAGARELFKLVSN